MYTIAGLAKLGLFAELTRAKAWLRTTGTDTTQPGRLSFGRGNFPGVQAEALDALETSYVGAIEREMTDKLRETMEAKVQASREHREYRMQQYLQLLRAQLAALRGEPARFPTQPSPSDERNLQRLRRARQFLVLVAEERPTAEAEALLPPPFPSNKPYRLYVSNMSVVPAHRRRGLAKRLLLQCERVARLWGHESIWLHVKRSNAAAAALYASMGYTPVESGGMRLLPGPLSQASLENEGAYYCQVSNKDGSVNSSKASLTVTRAARVSRATAGDAAAGEEQGICWRRWRCSSLLRVAYASTTCDDAAA
eukprot:XP_001693813.1 predicted protein [Chlamydomonas reinhardtii]